MTFVELMQWVMLKDGTGFHGGYTLNWVGFQLHCFAYRYCDNRFRNPDIDFSLVLIIPSLIGILTLFHI
jgi:hypothetical protein